jgi:hypothetical protein
MTHRKKGHVMNRDLLLNKLGEGLRLLSGLALALLLFQALGVLMYLVNVRPEMSRIPAGIALLGALAVAAALGRSALWIGIYRNGAGAVGALGSDGEAAEPEKLTGILDRLAKMLVTSCILDVLLLPAIFLMDVFFPFTLSSVHLGLIMLAAMLLPQAFGLAALLLAYLARQYGRLVGERCRMKSELDLTI